MGVVAQELEPVDVRADRLRERIREDMARIESIDQELDEIARQVDAVRAAAVAADPTGEPGARAKTEIRKLIDRADALGRERTEIEQLIPARSEVLGRLEEEVRQLGSAELTARRVEAEVRVRESLSLLAEQFDAFVSTWAGPFTDSLEALSTLHHEATAKNVNWTAVEPPVGPVPVDLLRLVEMLSVAAGVLDSPIVEAGFADACGFTGEGLREVARDAQYRLRDLHGALPLTSWASAHPAEG